MRSSKESGYDAWSNFGRLASVSAKKIQVWRKAASEFYEGYVPPFRSKGTVRGVSPALLMTHILSDDTERQGKRRERNKVEVRCLERVDWQTAVWYERTT